MLVREMGTDDLPTGMLASAETISVVAETLRAWQEKSGKELEIVLDPVRSPHFIIWHLLHPSEI